MIIQWSNKKGVLQTEGAYKNQDNLYKEQPGGLIQFQDKYFNYDRQNHYNLDYGKKTRPVERNIKS